MKHKYENDDFLEAMYDRSHQDLPNPYRWGMVLFSLGIVGFALAVIFVLTVFS